MPHHLLSPTFARVLLRSNRRCLSLLQNGPDQILPAEDFRAWDPSTAVKLRLQPSGPQSAPPVSVPTMFKNQVENLPNSLALSIRGPFGENLDWTWSDYYEDVLAVSRGFIALGLEPFHTVAILGHNDPAWFISNLAAIHAGGFSTGIYQTNSPSACQYIAQDSRANILVVGDGNQLRKILDIKDQLPHLRAIVQYGEDPVTEPGVISWQVLKELGKEQSEESIKERLRNMAINQCCILTYTSGTTGNPKGTMLSHDSVTYSSMQMSKSYYMRYGKESVVSYLPLSHAAGLITDIYIFMATGGTCFFADKNALKGTLIDNIKHYRPTRFVGVPRVFEKIEEAMKLRGAEVTGLKKKIGGWAKNQALRHHEKEMMGQPHTSLGYRLAKKLILSKVHEALGLDNTNAFLIGGSAVSPETVKFFLSLDIKLLEATAMTETCAMIQVGNRLEPGGFRIGKVGRMSNEELECKLISPDDSGAGELLSRGRSICMGYLNNQEKTLEAIDDEGWLHSGDLLRGDSEGFYTVVGRIKEIIITAGGENIAPTNIEDEIKRELPKVISNVMVVGDQKKYLTCLLTLKVQVDPMTMTPTDKLEPQAVAWVKSVGGGAPNTISELIEGPHWRKVEDAIQEGIERANQKAVSNVACVKKWTVLPREFSVDGGELSPSLKLKRFHVVEMYKGEISKMYGEGGGEILEEGL